MGVHPSVTCTSSPCLLSGGGESVIGYTVSCTDVSREALGHVIKVTLLNFSKMLLLFSDKLWVCVSVCERECMLGL